MDMEESAEESQAAESTYEEELIPKIITEEIFDEVCTRASTIVRDLQNSKQYLISEDVQKLLCVCQNLKQNLIDEQDIIEQMKGEVIAASGRVSHAVKMSKSDQDVIHNLKGEIDEAWRQADAAQSREQIAQEAMNVLREKLDKLQKEAEKYNDRGDSEEGPLAKQKEGVKNERDRLINELSELSKRFQGQVSHVEELEEKNVENEEKIKELYRILDEASNEAFKERRTLEHVQIKLQEITEERDLFLAESKQFKHQAEIEHRLTVQQNMQMLGLRANLDKHTTQNTLNHVKFGKLNADVDNLVALREKLNNDLNTKTNILKLKEDENAKFRLENAKIIKSREILMKKIMAIDASKSVLEQDIIKLKNQVSTLEKERELTKKSFEQAKKYADSLVRERDLVRKDFIKINKSVLEQKNHNTVLEQQLKTLENEIKQHIAIEQKLNNQISKADKEKEQITEEMQNFVDKIDEANEEINAKIHQINDVKEKLMENHAKWMKTQHELQTAQNDVLNLEREMQVSQEAKEELKEKIKVSFLQAEELKEQLANKDDDLKRSQKHAEKIEKEKQGLKVEIQSSLIALQHTKSELHEIKTENIKLAKTLRDSDASIEKLKKQLDALTSENELIKAQTTRKTEEMVLLNQKINVMQFALDRSNSQYNDRLEDIRLLKIEINNLRSQRNLLTKGIENSADQRQEVLQLNRVLVQERVRAKALEHEMTTPMNVHRWRKLSGIDPEKMELLVKVQTLQKRLLTQTSVLSKREETMQTFIAKNQILEDVVIKLPKNDIKEQLMLSRHKLSAHTKKMKAVLAISKVKDDDLKQKELTLAEQRNVLLEIKKELLQEKKDKNKLLEKMREIKRFSLSAQSAGNEYRIHGSGFKMKC